MDNQSKFKQEIVDFLKKDMQESLEILKRITTEDEEVKGELDKLRVKIKKMKNPSIPALFFAHKKRSRKYYAWWDEGNEEAIIYQYGKTE